MPFLLFSAKSREIPREYLSLQETVGEGQFGDVFRGELRIPGVQEIKQVAIKTCKDVSVTEKFMEEACKFQYLLKFILFKICFLKCHDYTIGVPARSEGLVFLQIPLLRITCCYINLSEAKAATPVSTVFSPVTMFLHIG